MRCVPAAGVLARLPPQRLGLASHSLLLLLDTREAPAPTTAVQTPTGNAEEKHSLLFQGAQDLIYIENLKQSVRK